MTAGRYNALVLAAGRGDADPMARAFDVTHKCLLKVGGVPMIVRVLSALCDAETVATATVSIEDPAILERAEGFSELARRMRIDIVESADRASASVARAIEARAVAFPVLVTTADHALLTAALIDEFCSRSAASGADLTVGLARDTTILAAYPGAVRTFLRFSDGRYSGCNLFTFSSDRARAAIDFWQHAERNRKAPWKLVRAFGIGALASYALGLLSLERAFKGGSRKLGADIAAIELHAAEAAIDVDKPSDLDLAEAILAGKYQVR